MEYDAPNGSSAETTGGCSVSEPNKPLVPSEHVPGSGCLCGASSSFECDCEIVDWRSRREVELEAENAKLRKVVEAAKEFSLSAERTLGLMSCKTPNCLRPFCKMILALNELEQTK